LNGVDVEGNGNVNWFHPRSPDRAAGGIAAALGGSATLMRVACGNALQTTDESWPVVPGAELQQPQLEPDPAAASGAARAGMRPKVVHQSSKSDSRMPRHKPPRDLAV